MKENNSYLEPLRTCAKTLAEADGINYVFLVCNACDDEDAQHFRGGSGWNSEGEPDFFSMAGGLIEHFLEESDLSYTDKLKIIREFYNNLVENLTNKESEE